MKKFNTPSLLATFAIALINISHAHSADESESESESESEYEYEYETADIEGEETIDEEEPISWSLGASLNNTASKSHNNDELDFKLDGAVNNLILNNDALSFQFGDTSLYSNTSASSHQASFSYGLELGNWSISSSAGISSYKGVDTSAESRQISQYYYNGSSQTASLSADYYYLQSDNIWTITGGINYEKYSDYSAIDTTFVGNDFIENGVETSANIGLSFEREYSVSYLSLFVNYQQGVPALGGLDDSVNNQSYMPTYNYQIFTFGGNYDYYFNLFNKEFNFNTDLYSQHSDSILYSSKYFSIGSRYSVRGFGDQRQLSGENGFYSRNTLSMNINDNHSLYVGVDAGSISSNLSNTAGGYSGGLAGGFIGAKGSLLGVFYDVFLANPIYQANNIDWKNDINIGFDFYVQI